VRPWWSIGLFGLSQKRHILWLCLYRIAVSLRTVGGFASASPSYTYSSCDQGLSQLDCN